MERFQETWTQHFLKDFPTKVVVGLSGGVDSMVLLDLLYHLPEDIRPAIFVVHINHHLRSVSDEEEAFVSEQLNTLGLPFKIYHWAKQKHPKTGLEAAARQFRYTAFREVMKQTESDYLATAHHKSDQVETLLMRLIRGGRWERMQGIAYKRPFATGELIRPLLNFKKEELYAYAHEHEIPFVEDATNQALDYTRNRYRQLIVPQLQKENPQMEEHVAQFAIDMQNVSKIVSEVIGQTLTEVTMDAGQILLRDEWLALPFEKRGYVLEMWLTRLYTDERVEWGQSQLDEITRWMRQVSPNNRLNLPGGKILTRTYNEVTLEDEDKQTPTRENSEAIRLQLNDWKKLSETESFGFFDNQHLPPLLPGDETFIIGQKDIALPLYLRHRQPGDRIKLKGGTGSKKVKDIFIDQKVPLHKRDEAWLLVDEDGMLLWLVGYKESTLSCESEPDKIQYVFIYRK